MFGDPEWYRQMKRLHDDKGKSLFGEERDDMYWGQIIGPLDDHWMYSLAYSAFA